MEKFRFKKSPGPNDPKKLSDFLSFHTGLSKQTVKAVLRSGAVWLKTTKGGGRRRVRRATYPVQQGVEVSLFYDPEILSLHPPLARCILDFRSYSIWYKPSGLLSQGSEWGDHCSLSRQTELFFTPRRKSFTVHRLDREASGVMIVAHTADAAARFSALFKERKLIKQYLVEVKGKPADIGELNTIAENLDSRPARTTFTVRRYDADRRTSLVDVRIDTGRKHQIRRHFNMIGYPVMGDPTYGEGNRDPDGLKLSARCLAFVCPFTGKPVQVRLEASDIPWTVSPEVLD